MKRMLLTILLICVASVGFAKNQAIHAHLQLLRLKAVKTAEQNGDELYMAVTAYPSNGKSTFYQVPKRPLHWPSRYLAKLKKLDLWNAELKNNESVTLILSLMEQDTPPWNTDDLIGSIRVHLHNNNGKLESSWSMPNRADAPINVMSKYGQAKQFDLLGEGSTYQVVLFLQQGKTAVNANHKNQR